MNRGKQCFTIQYRIQYTNCFANSESSTRGKTLFLRRNFKLNFIKNLLFLQSSLASTAGKEMRRVEEKRTREPNPFSTE